MLLRLHVPHRLCCYRPLYPQPSSEEPPERSQAPRSPCLWSDCWVHHRSLLHVSCLLYSQRNLTASAASAEAMLSHVGFRSVLLPAGCRQSTRVLVCEDVTFYFSLMSPLNQFREPVNNDTWFFYKLQTIKV